MKETINDRIRQVRMHFCNGSNLEFATRLNKQTNTTSNWVRDGYSVGRGVASEIAAEFRIDITWLLTGVGDMLKDSGDIQQIGAISGVDGQVVGNTIKGGIHYSGDVHHNCAKDRVIEEQDKTVQYSRKTLCEELQRSHEYHVSKDEYIKQLVGLGFSCHDEQLKRIDRLIDVVIQQNKAIQDRADQLFEIMQKQKE